jgi:hypothetical protein
VLLPPSHPIERSCRTLTPSALAGDFVANEIKSIDAVNEADAIRLEENDLQTKAMEMCTLQVGDRVLRDEWELHRIWRVGTVKKIDETSGELTIAFDDIHVGSWRAEPGDPRPRLRDGHLRAVTRKHARDDGIYKAPLAPSLPTRVDAKALFPVRVAERSPGRAQIWEFGYIHHVYGGKLFDIRLDNGDRYRLVPGFEIWPALRAGGGSSDDASARTAPSKEGASSDARGSTRDAGNGAPTSGFPAGAANKKSSGSKAAGGAGAQSGSSSSAKGAAAYKRGRSKHGEPSSAASVGSKRKHDGTGDEAHLRRRLSKQYSTWRENSCHVDACLVLHEAILLSARAAQADLPLPPKRRATPHYGAHDFETPLQQFAATREACRDGRFADGCSSVPLQVDKLNAARDQLRRELLRRSLVPERLLDSEMKMRKNLVENVRAVLFSVSADSELHKLELPLLTTAVARHCEACGADGKAAGGQRDRRFTIESRLPVLQPAVLASVGGDAFGALQTQLSAVDDCVARCANPKCKKPTHEDRRAAPWIKEDAMPPLVVFEMPDRAAIAECLTGEQLRSMRYGAVVQGDVERELQVKLLSGGTASASYKLLAVALYDGAHYVVEAHDGDTWQRVDGMDNGGCGRPCPTPVYGRNRCHWTPVCAVYERC